MERAIRVLLVDDDPEFAEQIGEYLERKHDRFEVVTERSASGALDRLAVDPVDCVVSDYSMPEMNGLDFLEAVRADRPDLPFVLYTGKGSEVVASDAISKGVTDYFVKGTPDANPLLAKRVENAVEHHRAEAAVEETRRRFRTLVRAARDVILVVDPDGTVTYATPSAEGILGRAPQQLVGTDGFDPVHEDDVERLRQEFQALVGDPERRPTVEFRYRRPDGEWIWIEGRGRNLLEEESVEGIVVYARDVTERKERERELAEYQKLVEHVGDPMYVLDAEGHLKTVNDALVEGLQRPRSEIVGEHVSTFMPDEDVERGNRVIQELLEDPDRKWASFEMRSLPADGDAMYNENKIAVLTDDDGEFVGSVGVVRDITERKAYEEELERQNRRLNEFASIVSHDLRNPLSVAEGRIDLLAEERDSEHVEEVDWALDRMRTLIEDLLVLAREGKAVDEVEEIALASAVETCWQNVDTAEATLAVETDAVLRADWSRLLQLLENLVRNSIEHAGPTVRVEVGDLGDGDGFYVADDGPGVPPTERDAVFDAGFTTSEQGTGFGLSIVSEVADAHGWTVEVCEAADGGARFELRQVDVVGRAEREPATDGGR